MAWRCANGEDVQRWYHLPSMESLRKAVSGESRSVCFPSFPSVFVCFCVFSMFFLGCLFVLEVFPRVFVLFLGFFLGLILCFLCFSLFESRLCGLEEMA